MGLSSREILRRLADAGWVEVAARGSHVQLKHATRPGRVTVPHPRKDIPAGTLRSIEKQSGVSMR
jgi:predicted RNA binding protein YcfA (HicA-like mRNA interferase family)